MTPIFWVCTEGRTCWLLFLLMIMFFFCVYVFYGFFLSFNSNRRKKTPPKFRISRWKCCLKKKKVPDDLNFTNDFSVVLSNLTNTFQIADIVFPDNCLFAFHAKISLSVPLFSSTLLSRAIYLPPKDISQRLGHCGGAGEGFRKVWISKFCDEGKKQIKTSQQKM